MTTTSPSMTMKALSVRQPWPWAMFNLAKDIENRSWRTHYRGPLLIHASKSERSADFEDAFDLFDEIAPLEEEKRVRRRRRILEEVGLGGLVGVVDLVDCVTVSSSPWFFGPFGFVLENPRPLPFIPFKGARGLFEVPPELSRRALMDADRYARSRAA